MKPCPAIIAALPREVRTLVKGWRHRQLPGNISLYSDGHAVVACAGMGAHRAALAVEAALAAMPVTALISAGLAGACDINLQVGAIVRAGTVIDARTSEQFQASGGSTVLVSSGKIASILDKSQFFKLYRADAVDMEAAAVARLAQLHKLEFRAIKAISDEADFDVQGLARFATADGQFREKAFAVQTALMPWMWPKAIALGRNGSKALKTLTAALNAELDWYKNVD
jgi:adenosylhomocysteine nucleosidase